VRSDENLSGRR